MKKMRKFALIIGRFQPFHLGHLSLVKRYNKAGYFCKIAIGSSQKNFEKDNPLTIQEREEIIKRVMKEFKIKDFKVYFVPDINDEKNYVKHILKIVGKFDVLITGNSKLLKLFLKYKTKSFDIESFEEPFARPGGKISSGVIRKRWLKKNDRLGLPKSAFNYLKSIGFSERLKEISKKN